MFPSNDSHSLSSKKLYYRVKTFHYKTRQNLGGADSIEKKFLQNRGGRPTPLYPPRLRTPCSVLTLFIIFNKEIDTRADD